MNLGFFFLLFFFTSAVNAELWCVRRLPLQTSDRSQQHSVVSFRIFWSHSNINPFRAMVEAAETLSGQKTESYSYSVDCHDDESWCEAGSLCDDSNSGLGKISDLDREWHRRHNQFHTIGYRDGLTAGKEASAQEGFNVGFKQSMLVGYNWGLVRGATSALVCLPDGLKENLVETLEKRDELQTLFESVHSLATRDALNMFHDDILASSLGEHGNHSGVHSDSAALPKEVSCYNQLGKRFKDFESFLLESPAIKVHLAVDLKMVG